MPGLLPEYQITKISFHKQPNSISATYRPMYRIAEILLAIRYCGKRSTMPVIKLQLVSWISHDSSATSVIDKLNKKQLIFQYMHIDTSINLAVDYAIGSNLLEITSTGKLKMTALGNSFIERIQEENIMNSFVEKLITINQQIKDLSNDQI